MHFIVIAVGAAAACWVYRDAQRFGYGKSAAMLWGLGTIFAFLFVFPIYLLWGRKFQGKQRRKPQYEIEQATIDADAVMSEDEAMRCPMCDKSVRNGTENCPHCGYTLNLTCKECGEALARNQGFCPNCGTKAPEK